MWPHLCRQRIPEPRRWWLKISEQRVRHAIRTLEDDKRGQISAPGLAGRRPTSRRTQVWVVQNLRGGARRGRPVGAGSGQGDIATTARDWRSRQIAIDQRALLKEALGRCSARSLRW